jgi:alpha-1,6-mannosyltransferase
MSLQWHFELVAEDCPLYKLPFPLIVGRAERQAETPVDEQVINDSRPELMDRVQSRFQRVSMSVEAARVRLIPPLALSQRVEADNGGPDDWTFLRRPALLGFLAILSICIGASLPGSPFKTDLAGTWFFGDPSASNPGQTFLLLPGVVAVYGGMILFIRVWFGLVQALRYRPGAPIRTLAAMMAVWIVPLLVVAPLFSKDVYSYAAQGEMMSHHINPYDYGPGTIGFGPYTAGVGNLWLNTPAPYGPFFLMLAGWAASLSGHNALVTVELLRIMSVAGVALIAYCIPKLARAYGMDPGKAFAVALLNPLTLLALIGGAHNDAIMVGLLVAGVTAAKYRHPVVGIVLCTLAAAIKVPAAIGIVYVAWDWAGPDVELRQRVKPLVKGGLIAVAVMAVLSFVSGLGWGWIANLGTPDAVRSWMAPATAVGLVFSGALHVLHIGVSLGGVLTITRLLGLIAATVIAGYCLLHKEAMGTLTALGVTALAFVLLGPVVQPWYLTWGIILMAPVVSGRLRTLVLGLSIVAPFIGLTGGASLLKQLLATNPAAMVVAVFVLWGVVMVPLGHWTSSWRIDRSRLGSALSAPSGAVSAAFES